MTGTIGKIAIVLLGFLCIYGLGYLQGRRGQIPLAAVSSSRVQTVEKVVYRDRVHEVERRTDGTVTTREIVRDVDKNSEQVVQSAVQAPRPNYMAGVSYRLTSTAVQLDPWDRKNVEIMVGRRIAGDIWTVATASRDSMTLGILYEW